MFTNVVAWFRQLLKEEPVVIGWLVNGGLAAVAAYLFRFNHGQEAALATVVAALVTIWTATHTKPANFTVLSGAVATILAAIGGFGLHFSTHATAAIIAVASLVFSLIVRSQVSPKK